MKLCESCNDTAYHPPNQHDDCECDCNGEREYGFRPGWINVPQPFVGSAETEAANTATHRFDRANVCVNCEVRRYGTNASYPCLQPAPRVLVRQGSPEAYKASATGMIAAILGGVGDA